ncbi:MAG TPA: NAD-dependent epimerase/dehydratase family protein [Terriglobales bacterium]|nr:NAD-dependent epimerase/dehydratase family protein [Terriglobales bacterium]
MSSSSPIVVTGGTGFIGHALVNLLEACGERVKVVSRSADPRQSHGNITYVKGDVADAASMMQHIAGASTVFHLAAGGGDRWSDYERDVVGGARNVAAACKQHKIARLIYTSTIAALYLGRGGTIDETTGPDPKPMKRSHYSRAKIFAENLYRDLHAREGLPVVIVRPGLVMGRGGVLNHTGVGTWPSDISCLGWGQGNNPLPFVLVQDVAQALVACVTTQNIEGRAFNLAGDVFLTAREFVSLTAERARRRFHYHPQSLLKMQAVELGKWMLKAAAGKPENPFPSFYDLKSRSLRTAFDCKAAKEVLRWQPNADPEVFFREAIASHLRPLAVSDLRLPRTSAVPA